MNKKLFQKFYIILALTILGIGLFVLAPVYAGANGLIDVVFENGGHPLFQEANFLPGQEIVHWVEVTNKSDQVLPIGVKMTKLINSGSDKYFLADKLNLIIKDKDSNKLYENSLTGFFSDGEKKIADLAADPPERYYFSITFLPGSDDNYQGLGVDFDFQIGALGTESIGGEGSGGGTGGGTTGGGGSYFVPGLQIFNESASGLGGDQATITWDTTYDSTSRVIYSSGLESHVLQLDNPPDYGYAHSTIEDTAKVTSPHSVTISGLTSGTTYYYRCISHGSFAVSVEHSFTTPGVEIIEEENENNEILASKPGAGESEGKGGNEGESEGGSGQGEEITLQLPAPVLNEIGMQEEQEGQKTNLGKFFAAIGSLFNFKNIYWFLIISIIVLVFLILLFRKKREK